MKKINASHSKLYSNLLLYKNDLEDIINIFKDNGSAIDLSLDRYEFSDVSDIDNVKSKLKRNFTNNFKAYTFIGTKSNTFKPFNMALSMDRDGAYVRIEDDEDAALIGKMTQLDKIFKRSGKIRRILFSYPFLSLMSMVSFLSILFFLDSYLLYFQVTFGSLFLLTTPLLILGCVMRIKGSRIYLMDFNDRTSFFKRNKDQIFMALFGIVCAVVGSIITLIIQSSFSRNRSSL